MAHFRLGTGARIAAAFAMAALGVSVLWQFSVAPAAATDTPYGTPVGSLPTLDCVTAAVIPDMKLQFGEGVALAEDDDTLLVYGQMASIKDGKISGWHLKVAAILLSSGDMTA